jgi:hypothetical protein
MSNFHAIRVSTRVALPADDGYLFRLGVALYGFTYVNSFMTEIISYLDPTANRVGLLACESGIVLDTFRMTGKRWNGESIQPHLRQAAACFERLNTERSDFVHAYPITSPSG